MKQHQPQVSRLAARAHAPAASARAEPEVAESGLAGDVSVSPRQLAQRDLIQRMFSSPQGVVQRHPAIAGMADGDDGTAVEKLLKKYGIHYYYSYGTAAQSVDGDFADSAEDAKRLAGLLGNHVEHLDDGHEVQSRVQRKLLEICELVRTQMSQVAPESPQERAQRASWYDSFLLNGLCLGFVRVFEQHPEWLTGMWRALSTWRLPHGLSVTAILRSLNEHIESVMRFDDGLAHANMWEAVLLAQEAWANMEDENGDPYERSPVDAIHAVTGSASGHESISMNETDEDKTWPTHEVHVGHRWAVVMVEIERVIGNRIGRFHIIVYHEGHEMAIQYSRADDKARTEKWIVSETNAAGIVPCGSWREVGALVGRQLDQSEDEFGVEVKSLVPRS